jgi:hypothetical protein
MFKAFVGHSNDPDSQWAIAEVLQQCQDNLNGEVPQAGVLLAAIDFDHALILAQIQDTFPGIELIGCSTNGEISSVMGFQEDSLTLMVFCSDQVEIRAGLGRGVVENVDAAVAESVAMATAKLSSPPKLCLTFPESMYVDGVTLIAALQKDLGKGTAIVGGSSADNLTFDATKQFFQSEVTSGAIPILLFAGNINCSYGVVSGWQPIGKKSKITKAKDSVIYEIDGKKAIDFYRDSLGGTNTQSDYSNYPLAIAEEGSTDFFLRSPLSHDEENGSMIFTASIAEGSTVRMSEASRENILNATALSLESALAKYSSQSPAGEIPLIPSAAIVISCAARHNLLGTRTKEEYEIFKTKLPPNLPCCGFYSYGEISPNQLNQSTQFHNQTFVTLLIGET